MIFLALTCIALAIIVLIALSIIDLKTWILPDPLNLALAVLGILFHVFIRFEIFPPYEPIFGAIVGAGLLYIIRVCGNAYYKQESLGLGDVKLLGAAGLWLGVEGTIFAIVLGALAGIVHGIILATCIAIKHKTRFSLNRLMLPAGPGFCVGIVLAGIWVIGPYFGLEF